MEEKQSNQFCRACGIDLRPAQMVLEKPDAVTASAASAREAIGRAIAAKIEEIESAEDLKKVAEDVLPGIEKFLESPAEKRLRRMRQGTIIAAVGLGAAIMFQIMTVWVDREALFLVGAGIAVFLIGLSFIVNGLLFSVPQKLIPDNSNDAESQRQLDSAESSINRLNPADANYSFSSVTENTTQHLQEKQPVRRD